MTPTANDFASYGARLQAALKTWGEAGNPDNAIALDVGRLVNEVNSS
jgi:hypothetical protein